MQQRVSCNAGSKVAAAAAAEANSDEDDWDMSKAKGGGSLSCMLQAVLKALSLFYLILAPCTSASRDLCVIILVA